jgi:hypothetical protein
MAKRCHAHCVERASMLKAAKGFRRLKAHKQLPLFKTALAAHRGKYAKNRT